MDNIASPRDVKLRKIKSRLEAAFSSPYVRRAVDIVTAGTASERTDPIKRPEFRALCLDCDWTFQSKVSKHDPERARNAKRAHEKSDRHRARTVFDIVGQLDEEFSAR